jgi:hypothetical protein
MGAQKERMGRRTACRTLFVTLLTHTHIVMGDPDAESGEATEEGGRERRSNRGEGFADREGEAEQDAARGNHGEERQEAQAWRGEWGGEAE